MKPQWQEHRQQTALGSLFVRCAGTGPVILFWPSLLMDGSMWMGVAERLLTRFRVVLIDSPGHGRSEPLSAPFGFDECAHCIVSILDALAIERAHFVGNSWGAMIGGTFAARYPDRIGAAILMNGTASACGARQRLEFRMLILAGRLLRGVRGPLRKRATAAFLGPTSLRTRPQVVGSVAAALKRVDFRSARWAIESVVVSRPDQTSLFRGIRSPVMVVAGVEDATFPNAETRAMAEAIPASTFVLIDGSAHLTGLECPEKSAELIESFIRAHD